MTDSVINKKKLSQRHWHAEKLINVEENMALDTSKNMELNGVHDREMDSFYTAADAEDELHDGCIVLGAGGDSSNRSVH